MSAFDQVLERYRLRAAAERQMVETAGPAMYARRDELLLEVGEDVGFVLRSLAVARGAKRILELGTSYGFSTLFLAEAARRTGGVVVTLELSPEKQAYARSQLSEAGLDDDVEWHCGDALDLLARVEGPFDFVLIDLWKELYVPCLELLYPKLADGAIIAADNMIHPAIARPDAEAYRAAVKAKPDLRSVLLPIGSGIELSCLWRTSAA